jgi:hypothetical protein
MSNEPMQARGPDGGGGGGLPSAMDLAERDHLDRVELGKIEQYTETLEITPAYAGMVLSRYAPAGSNRSLRAGEVRVLAETMRAGRWDSRTHQGAAFDLDGNLSDGQHRFRACIMSGVSIRLPVTFGQPRAVFSIIDQGAGRGAKDLVQIAGLDITNANDASSTARTLLVVRRGAGDGPSRSGLTKGAVLEFVAANVDELNVAVRMGHNTAVAIKGSGASRSHFGAAAFLIRAACRDHAAVDRFFDQLREGADLAARSPVLLLRDGLKSGGFLTANPQGETRAKMLVAAVVNGWNLWRARRLTTSTRAIIWKIDQQFPQARP